VSTAAPGLTIALSKTGSAVVEAVANRDALKDAVKTLVSEFNKLKQFYDRAQKRDANAELTPLANDAILRQIYSEIRRVLLGANDNGGELDYLAEIGIEFASNGELKFVELRFNEAVDTRLSDVQQLFQGSGGTGGLFRDLQTRLTSLDATSGVVKTARTSLELTLQRDEDRVDAMQLRLDLRRQELVKIYAAADEAMSRMNQSLTSLSSISGRLF
jgi:flagellar hook-associated protein 2